MKVVFDSSGNPAAIHRDENGAAGVLASTEGAEVVDLDEQRPHLMGWCVCECGHHNVAVVDLRANLDTLECSKCGNQTGALQKNKPADVIAIR